jgi:hypothetical protein
MILILGKKNSPMSSKGNIDFFGQSLTSGFLHTNSNRTIGMAAAYYTIMQWKLSAGKPDPALFGNSMGNELQWLQDFAAKQASMLFDKSDTLSSDRSTAAKMAVGIVTQLHSQ